MKKLQSSLVLIKVDAVQEQDDHGVFMTEEWKELPQTGFVIMAGDKVKFCKVGEHVLFTRYAAIRTPVDGQLLCQEQDVLALV
jgi:co-chaperonin GroES (HSP10)